MEGTIIWNCTLTTEVWLKLNKISGTFKYMHIEKSLYWNRIYISFNSEYIKTDIFFDYSDSITRGHSMILEKPSVFRMSSFLL